MEPNTNCTQLKKDAHESVVVKISLCKLLVIDWLIDSVNTTQGVHPPWNLEANTPSIIPPPLNGGPGF